jgi:nucleotide-binding universal stress UspA family protein
MNILLAVDGSEHSLNAVSSLIAHANWFKEPPKVHLLYVHLPVPTVGGAFGHGPSKEALETYYREEGDQALAEAKKLLDAARVPHSDAILVGQPEEMISQYAADEKCELICMGTRGLGSAASLVLGSVANKVLHSAKVPVLLVK